MTRKGAMQFVMYAGLGFLAYMLVRNMNAKQAAAAAAAARQGAAAARQITGAAPQPSDKIIGEYGLNGSVVSEQ